MGPIRPAFACLVTFAFLIHPSSPGFPKGDEAGPRSCIPRYVDALGQACEMAGGGFRVFLADGTVLTTHGPDFKIHAPPADHGTGIGPGDPERNPVCATDYYQHVMYGRPSEYPDPFPHVFDDIRSIVRRMNAVLNEASIASGGPTADYKVLCNASGEIQIDSFTVPGEPTGEYGADFDAIVQGARDAGFKAPNADYTILYEAHHPSVCGVGSYRMDDRPTADNPNNQGGGYGVSFNGCWERKTPMHENGHNQGAVQRTAPFSDLTGHCLEGRDVMCYTDGLLNIFCPAVQQYDCGFDTYFDAKPEPGEWLATHWNIGSRVNRFIRFGP